MATTSALAKHRLMFSSDQTLAKSTTGVIYYHEDIAGVGSRSKKTTTTCFGYRPLRWRRCQQVRKFRWRTPFALDTGGSPNTGDPDSTDGDNTGLGRTRLGIIVRAAARQLLEKLNDARKNFPMKVFLLLLGFYTANALATILGQTGDWDVLVAGVVVAAIEGIGMLMYRKPFSRPVGRFQSLVVMKNYKQDCLCKGVTKNWYSQMVCFNWEILTESMVWKDGLRR